MDIGGCAKLSDDDFNRTRFATCHRWYWSLRRRWTWNWSSPWVMGLGREWSVAWWWLWSIWDSQTRSSSVYSSVKILDRLRLVLQKWHFLTSKQCMLSWNTCENLQWFVMFLMDLMRPEHCTWTPSWCAIGVFAKELGFEEDGCKGVQRTQCFNRRNFQSYNPFDDGESLDGHESGQRFAHVSFGCQRCLSSSLATWRCCSFSTQLGESCSGRSQSDVLAVAEMFARATRCCDTLERAPHKPSWWAQLRAHAWYPFQTPWKGHFPFSSHWRPFCWLPTRRTQRRFSRSCQKSLTLKIDGPYGVNEPGKMFYLKRQVEIGEDWVFIAPNGKYIPKLAELLEITKRRRKAVPHHSALTVFDVEIIPMEEYLMDKDAKTFRSALGVCLYIAQERLDIQQAVRVLSSYMGRPTKTALCALRKLGSYLVQTQDMQMHYPRAELFSSTLTRWNGY